MLSRLVNVIAHFFYVNNIIENKEDVEVYAYGLELLFSSALNVIAVLLISLTVGQFFGTIAFFIAFIPLRTYAGGFHAADHLKCFLILIIVYLMDLLIVFLFPQKMLLPFLLICTVFSTITIYLFSPVDDANKCITDIEKVKYRKISIIIVLAQIVIASVLFMFWGISNILLHFVIGQLAASSSLMFAKIYKIRKDVENEKNNATYNQV